jgi:hypothetical protein
MRTDTGATDDLGVFVVLFETRRPSAMARRAATLVVTTVLASLVALVVNQAPAAADKCPSGRSWVPVVSGGQFLWYESYDFALVSSSPTFNVSDSRAAYNQLDTPVGVTFTSSQSRTYTISTSASMQAKLLSWLTATVSRDITQSRTTQVGVSVSATVPPLSGVQADYGVQAYNVTYNVHTVRMYFLLSGTTSCSDLGTATQTVNAPTTVEGWRVYEVPLTLSRAAGSSRS